jgi:hypothetical protein
MDDEKNENGGASERRPGDRVRVRPQRARGSATEAGRDVNQALRWERKGALHQGRL